MKHFILSISFIFLTLLAICQDIKNIQVTGCITDQATGIAIPNAEVVVLCWYKSGIDDASFVKSKIYTDSAGVYKIKFKKGYQIDVASKADKYQPNRSYNELLGNKVLANLKLQKSVVNPSLKTVLNTDKLPIDMTDDIPFLRVRYHLDKGEKIINAQESQTYGFDLKTLRTTTDTISADFWFKIEALVGQPKTIITNNAGGIIPIKSREIKSSLLYEFNIAPTSGYLTSYTLQKDDEGFFVLSRDGKSYGKIILEKATVDNSEPDGKGSYYRDLGKNFSCFYQPDGTTNLNYSKTDIDLERFLVDYRMQ